jgi:hypothetical protein
MVGKDPIYPPTVKIACPIVRIEMKRIIPILTRNSLSEKTLPESNNIEKNASEDGKNDVGV